MSFKAAILGLGNIGRSVIRALETVPDAECIGVVRRPTSVGTTPYDLRGVPDFPSFDELLEHGGNPDVVILGLPSRLQLRPRNCFPVASALSTALIFTPASWKWSAPLRRKPTRGVL